MARQHYDFDAILIGDLRFGREPAEILLSAIRLLTGRGLTLGVASLRDPADRTGRVHPAIASTLQQGRISLLEPGGGPVWGRLAIVAGAGLLTTSAATLAGLRARHALVMIPEGVLDRGGQPRFEAAAVAALIERNVVLRQQWCPADGRIRTQLGELGLGPLLHPEDWPPVVDVAAWRIERLPPEGRRLVLGHASGRGIDLPAADRAGLLARYPVPPDLAFHLHGDLAALRKLSEPLPPGWQLIGSEQASPRRFLSRLDFFVLQPERVPHTPPRGLLEAMAAGRVALLAPGFRAALGDGLAYRTPEQVADTARYLGAEPAFYERYRAAQDRVLARHAPEAFWQRLAPALGEPAARRAPATPAPARRRIAFYPTNGIGLGHVTRLLAIARRLDAALERVFFTPCHALAVVEHAGYRTEYVSEPSYDETSAADHARAMAPSLARAFHHYGVEAVVFDGNVPRDALVMAAAERDVPFVWVRRGMWRADPSLARFLDLARHADAVIEPQEVAAEADAGATAAASDRPIQVPPVVLLDPGELLARRQARAALRLPAQRPCVLVQLGSGNNRDTEDLLEPILAAAARLGIELLVAEWLISNNPIRRKNVRYLSAFPNARYLNAFDFAISAAGYNSFHELLHHGVPCIFPPNDDQRVDDQRARAGFADARGAGICVPRGAEAQIGRYMEIMLDPDHRRLIGRRARGICPANGARAAAAAIEAVVARG